MFAVNLRSRAVVAVVGLCAVVGLMTVSVGAVQAGAAQTEDEAKVAAEARAKEAYAEHMQAAVHHARQAAEAGRSPLAGHLAKARARWAGARRHGGEGIRRALQGGYGRMHAVPGMAMRRRGSGGGSRTAERVLRMAEELELTEQQEGEIRDVWRQHRRAAIERDAAIEVAELDLEDLMQDPHTADLAAVEQQMQAIGKLRVENRVAGLRLTQQVWGTLTAEQRDQLQDDRHNVFFLRGDGPHAWSLSGDDFTLGIDVDDFPHEGWMNDFDFDCDVGDGLPFGLWREWLGDEELHEHHQEEQDADREDEVKTNAGSDASGESVGVGALF